MGGYIPDVDIQRRLGSSLDESHVSIKFSRRCFRGLLVNDNTFVVAVNITGLFGAG